MSNPIFIRGSEALGKLVIRTRKNPGIHKRIARWLKQSGLIESTPDVITQGQFAEWVSAMSGVVVTESAIGRLERGEGQTGPPIGVLIALCKYMKILQLPNGSYCDMNRVVDILCGEMELDQDWLVSE